MTNCRNWLTKNSEPNIAKNTNVTATDAAVNRGLAKNDTSRFGAGQRRSHSTNAVGSTTAAMNDATISGSPQPSAGPWMMPNSSAISPVVDSAVPTTSNGGAAASREFGTTATAAITVTATTGTLTRKIEPHQKCCSRNPPVNGPMATPSPDTPAQMAIARARSAASVNTLVRIDSVAGMMNAAPRPWTPRIRINGFGLCICEHAKDPTPKISSPPIRHGLRPSRSPVLPATSRNPANTIV